MTTARPTTPTVDADETVDATDNSQRPTWWLRLLPLVGMWVTIVISAILPLRRNEIFYYWDDTAAAATGVWQKVPSELLSGHVPVLNLDMWRGGNFAAEAATGMWNPVMVALMFVAHAIDDLAIAMAVAKIAFMLICGTGVYLLARSFEANPWLAAAAGAALPVSGWTLFVDGTAWINGLAVSAFTPWAWWALRRAYQAHFSPGRTIGAVVAGAVLVSTGNPYSMLTILAVFVALLGEAVADRRVRALVPGFLIGFTILLTSLLVYLPFLGTSHVGFRAESGLYNDEFIAANLNHLLGLSAPTFHPWLPMYGGTMAVPAAYLAWFVLPLLPWVRWREASARFLAGPLTYAAFFLILVLGPSQIVMFRWPGRLLPFLYLGVIVLFAVLLSRGLARDRRRLRALWSSIAIGAGWWMSFSDHPEHWKYHTLATLVIIVFTAVAVLPRPDMRRLFLVFAGGTVVTTFLALQLSPSFVNTYGYDFPRSKSAMQENFDDRYVGTTLQIMNYEGQLDYTPEGGWKDMLLGNMFAAADVDSLTAYSGVGFTVMDKALCSDHKGMMCEKAWDEVWDVPRGGTVPFVDQMRVETIVVAHESGDHEAPEGWRVAETTDFVTVYRRTDPLPLPGSTVGDAGDAVEIEAAALDGETSENIEFSSSDGSDADRTITLARVAWPGYTATLDGKDLEVETSPVGLLEVTVPPGVDSGELEIRFQPPGWNIALGGIAAAVVLTAGFAVIRHRRPEGVLSA